MGESEIQLLIVSMSYELNNAISNTLCSKNWCCTHIDCYSPVYYSVWCCLVSLERQMVPFMQQQVFSSVFYDISGFFLQIYLVLKEFFFLFIITIFQDPIWSQHKHISAVL